MKKLFTLFLLLTGLSGFAQTTDSTAKAKLVFFRFDDFYKGGVALPVTINDSVNLVLLRHSYGSIEVPAGSYTVKKKKARYGSFKVKASPGQTVYIVAHFVNGRGGGYWQFQPTDSSNAYFVVKNPYADNMSKPYLRPTHRLGISLDMGGGFDNIFVGTASSKSNDQVDVTFSYGGGFGLGLNYGAELSKNFELGLSFGWHKSSLSPQPDNADMSFSRLNASATGFFVIPLQGGYRKRIKLGAGLDYLFNNILKIDMPAQAGSGAVKDKWTYKATQGFHGTLLYEVNPAKSFSWNIGVSYNNARYSFEKGSNYYPTTSRFKTPDGQGLFLILGVNFHF